MRFHRGGSRVYQITVVAIAPPGTLSRRTFDRPRHSFDREELAEAVLIEVWAIGHQVLQTQNRPGIYRSRSIAEKERVSIGFGNLQPLQHFSASANAKIVLNRVSGVAEPDVAGLIGQHGRTNLDSNMVYTPAAAGAEKAYVTERLDDVSKTLSRFGEAIAIRIYGDPTGWNYGQGNEYVRAFAAAADVPVINMECDKYHPCQGLADVMTMKEKLGNLEVARSS